jgi:hypothetical protein
MSKTEPLDSLPKMAAPKFPFPKGSRISDNSPPPQREIQPPLTYGARESVNTTVKFLIRPGRGVDDLLMIGMDEHNGERASRLMIRGGYEAMLIPSHLRWLAGKIEKELGKIDAPTNNEYVLSTGGWK